MRGCRDWRFSRGGAGGDGDVPHHAARVAADGDGPVAQELHPRRYQIRRDGQEPGAVPTRRVRQPQGQPQDDLPGLGVDAGARDSRGPRAAARERRRGYTRRGHRTTQEQR